MPFSPCEFTSLDQENLCTRDEDGTVVQLSTSFGLGYFITLNYLNINEQLNSWGKQSMPAFAAASSEWDSARHNGLVTLLYSCYKTSGLHQLCLFFCLKKSKELLTLQLQLNWEKRMIFNLWGKEDLRGGGRDILEERSCLPLISPCLAGIRARDPDYNLKVSLML